MAIVQNPIVGRAKNKFAGAVFSTWKGLNVLRSKPLTVANPKSPAQRLQREKLRQGVELYRKMPGTIQKGFSQQAVGMSEYNAFMSDLLKNAIDGSTEENVEIDYTELLLAKGTMQSTPIKEVSFEDHAGIVTWSTSGGLAPGQSSSDSGYVVLIHVADVGGKVTVMTQQIDVIRSGGESGINNGLYQVAGDVYIYLFFVSNVNGSISDSTMTEYNA